jgi:cytochrome c peroxidase
MHTGADVGVDDFQANRSPDKRYRTSPLKGLFAHQKGGFFHDGRLATLRDVVDHYNQFFGSNLTDRVWDQNPTFFRFTDVFFIESV